MIATACAMLFALAAVASLSAIVSTMRTYGEDILALRATRHFESDHQLAWRIVETPPACEFRALLRPLGTTRMSVPVLCSDPVRLAA